MYVFFFGAVRMYRMRRSFGFRVVNSYHTGPVAMIQD
jgi:hypothetical protein